MPIREPPSGRPASVVAFRSSTGTATQPPIDPRIRQRRIAVRRDEGRRRLRLVLGFAGVLLLLGAGWAATRSALFDVDHVRVVGAVHTPSDAVVRASGLRTGQPMTGVHEAGAAARVRALPWVATVAVERDWPGTIVITVTERRAAAVARARGGGWMLVDAGGRLLERVPLPPEDLVALERTPPAGRPGDTLAAAARGALAVAVAVPPERVGQLRVVHRLDDGSIEIHVVPRGIVRFGPPTAVAEKMTAALTVLDHADLARVAVLDVQVPTAPVLTRT